MLIRDYLGKKVRFQLTSYHVGRVLFDGKMFYIEIKGFMIRFQESDVKDILDDGDETPLLVLRAHQTIPLRRAA